MRLEPGHVVSTSYGTGPYLIVNVVRGCTCTEYVASLDYMIGEGPLSAPHMHLTCEYLDGPSRGKKAWLSGYDDNLMSVWNKDSLVLLKSFRSVQVSMDFRTGAI